MVMTFLPDPGAVAANLSKGTNLGEWLNQFFSQNSLLSTVWDIFGRFTTVPAVATALLGVLTGNLLLSNEDYITKSVNMFIAGNIMIFIAYIWSFWFPINKLMWTSTFVLFTGGFALNLFSLCFWVVDVKEYKFWIKPFQAFGMNALAVYFLAVLAGRYLKFIKVTDVSGNLVNLKGYIYRAVFLPLADPVHASFMYGIVYTLFWLGFVWFLYKKKIFIKV
jgi:predicted acyltransferase